MSTYISIYLSIYLPTYLPTQGETGTAFYVVLDGEVRVMQVPAYISKGRFLSSPDTTVLGQASSQSCERASRVARVTVLLTSSGA